MGNFGANVASASLTAFEQLRIGQSILRQEAEAIQRIAGSLDESFCRAADLLISCSGNVIVSGMGKAGLIGRKIVATLASTGTSSHFLHPAEAIHGDLGRIRSDDCVLMMSYSGETEEVVRLLPTLQQMQLTILAITGNSNSTLGRAADVLLTVPVTREACPLGLAPSTSTTAMLALGDALALVVSRRRDFRAEDFARFHPGGSLGRKLSLVDDWMRPLSECRVAPMSRTVREVFVQASLPGRRPGAIMLTDSEGRLAGVFTDSDLAKLLESRSQEALDEPIAACMTCDPITVVVGQRASAAIELFSQRKISELPVVDDAGIPQGMMDITDVVPLLPGSDPPVADGQRGDERVSTVLFPKLTEGSDA